MLLCSFFLRVTSGVFSLEHLLLVRVVLGPRVISGWSCSTIKPIKRLFFRNSLPTLGIQPVIVSAPHDSPISDFTLSFRPFHLTDEELSCSSWYPGDSSGYGRSWMVLILQRTWCDVWQTTIQRWDFGEVGTEAIIFGSSGEFWNSPILLTWFCLSFLGLVSRIFFRTRFWKNPHSAELDAWTDKSGTSNSGVSLHGG